MRSSSIIQYIALPFIVMGTFSLLYFGPFNPGVIANLFRSPMIDNAFVDARLKGQLATFAIALVVLGVTYLASKKNAQAFYRVGNIDAPAEPVYWLGIKKTNRWKSVGRSFAIIVSIATSIFVYLNVASGQTLQSENLRFLPFIFIFAGMNAFTEEAITRLSLVAALHGTVPDSIIAISSALLFGIPHYFGVPGGILGSLMAAFLGWLLAKSILETRGFFWAWFIHFLQDVIIFTALFLAAL